MDPELVDEIEAIDEGDHRRVETKKHQRHLQDEHAGEQPGPALSQRSREIVMLAGVVVDVLGPHPAHAVRNAVVPVVAEVVEQEGGNEDPHRQAKIEKAKLPDPDQRRVGNDAEQDAGDHIARAHHEARQSIACFEGAFGAAGAYQPELYQDGDNKKRNRQFRDLGKIIGFHQACSPTFVSSRSAPETRRWRPRHRQSGIRRRPR